MPRLLIAVALLAFAAPASSQAPQDFLRDCEVFAIAESKRDGGSLKSVRIARGDSLIENRFDRKIGGVHVSTEYLGRAQFIDDGGSRNAAFVCLHAGSGKKPVYFVEVPIGR
ncbi:MAG: hypothetical protein K2Z25_24225 [Beijerinckiaceae bacterium]|nr:hypothetical protein [Beijerinckiaceae bacterium]